MKKLTQIQKVFLLTLSVIVIFGYLDAQQILAVYSTQAWDVYNQYVAPAFNSLLYIGLAAVAIVYYLIKKDKSESIGIFLSGLLMGKMGVGDVAFFIFGKEPMTACMDWFGPLQNTVSKYILQESCVSPLGLWLNALLGIVVAYLLLKYLKEKL